MTDLVQPFMESSVSETMKEVVSSTARVLRSGELSSFDEVAARLTFEVSKRQEHFGSFGDRIARVSSAMCRNAAAMCAGRKVKWLLHALKHALQESANRVVSQTWAEGVESSGPYTPGSIGYASSSAIHPAEDGRSGSRSTTGHNLASGIPTLPQSGTHSPAANRGKGRRRKSSQEMRPVRCKLCSRVFNGNWRDDHLRRHVGTVHSNDYFTCELCGKRLQNRTDNFAKHLRTVHPEHMLLVEDLPPEC